MLIEASSVPSLQMAFLLSRGVQHELLLPSVVGLLLCTIVPELPVQSVLALLDKMHGLCNMQHMPPLPSMVAMLLCTRDKRAGRRSNCQHPGRPAILR